MRRIAIIGAGPIGLEAAIYARLRGHDVVVLERGRIADNLRRWGHVRLFSPFAMNSSEWGRGVLSPTTLPASDEILTGLQFADRYLGSLSQHPLLSGRICERTTVLRVGRKDLWKGDLIGKPGRAESPFVLLTQSKDSGSETTVEVDVVLDCSGTYLNHNWLGAGGIPCPGEFGASDRISYHLPDIDGRDRERFANQTTLVVGGGFSAATAILALANVRLTAPRGSILWLTRSAGTAPLAVIPNDPLPERAALTVRANELATGDSPTVNWLPSHVIRRLDHSANGLTVHVESAGRGEQLLQVDQILAMVGYRPDRTLYEELQIHECYASQGPIKLAAKLLGEKGSDCTQQKCADSQTLKNPEPNFFILGAKSYGRDSRFLLRVGIEQIMTVFSLIDGVAK